MRIRDLMKNCHTRGLSGKIFEKSNLKKYVDFSVTKLDFGRNNKIIKKTRVQINFIEKVLKKKILL